MAVRCMGHQVLGRFVAAAIEGISSNGRWPELLEALAEIAPHRTDTTLYFAEMDEQVEGHPLLGQHRLGYGYWRSGPGVPKG